MRYAVLLILLTSICVSCGGGNGAGATPKESYESVKSAMKDKDWGALFELLPPSFREKGEKQLKENPAILGGDFGLDAESVKGMTLKEVFVAGMPNVYKDVGKYIDSIADSEYVDDKIDDTRAAVKIKMGDEEGEINFVCEDGKWYFLLDW